MGTGPKWAPATVPPNPFGWFFLPGLGQFPCTHLLISTLLNTQGQPSEALANFLCLPLLCTVNCSPLSLQILISIFPTQGVCWVLLIFPLFASQPGNSLKPESQGKHEAYLTCFLSQINHLPSLLYVQYLEKCCLIYFVWFFNCFSKKGKSGPCYSALARRGRYKYTLKNNINWPKN